MNKTEKVPVEFVRGADEVTVWLWPDSPDPVTVHLTYYEWAKVERKAEEAADGEVERVLGQLLQQEIAEHSM